MPRTAVVACYGLLASVCLLGCGGSADGPPRGSISGRVTLDNQPVDGGTIYFLPAAGTPGPMASGPITEGEYSLSASAQGPVVGTHQVKIEWYRETGEKDSGGAPVSAQVIPANYNSQSTLLAEIKAGSNQQDFGLTSR
jgi:hypothetical protein